MASLAIGSAFDVTNLAMHLLYAHDARVQAAKEENGALNQAVVAFQTDMNTIFTALNRGDVTPQVAIQTLEDYLGWYWGFIEPYQQGALKGPEVCARMSSAQCSTPGSDLPTPCAGGCTAGCCVGCNFFQPEIAECIAVVQRGGGTVSFCAVGANKYGFTGIQAFSVNYKKPKHVVEAEVTIDKKTGIVTVGAPPSSDDVVVAGGVIAKGAQSDSGGDVIQKNALGQDINVTGGSIFSGKGLELLILGGLAVGTVIIVLAARK